LVILLAERVLLLRALVTGHVPLLAYCLALRCSLLLLLFSFEFSVSLNGWPVDSITNWFPATAKNREGIKPDVLPKDLFPVFSCPNIVLTLKRSALLV